MADLTVAFVAGSVATSLLIRVYHAWIARDATRLMREFLIRFPGRCPVCAFHRYGVNNGHTSGPCPPHHPCPEVRMQPHPFDQRASAPDAAR